MLKHRAVGIELEFVDQFAELPGRLASGETAKYVVGTTRQPRADAELIQYSDGTIFDATFTAFVESLTGLK